MKQQPILQTEFQNQQFSMKERKVWKKKYIFGLDFWKTATADVCPGSLWRVIPEF